MAAATPNNWQPPLLDLSVDRYAAFKSWKARWSNYKVVTKLDDQAVEYQCSMLRYTFSEETRKIYDTLGLTGDEEKDPKVILEKLESFAKGTVNVRMERHAFNTRNQEEGELFDDFLTEIKILSKNCAFCDTCYDGLIRDRIVAGIRDRQLRQKLLADDKLDLKKAEDTCRAKEKAKQGEKLFSQSKGGPATEEEVNELSHTMRRQKFGNRRSGNKNDDRETEDIIDTTETEEATEYDQVGEFEAQGQDEAEDYSEISMKQADTDDEETTSQSDIINTVETNNDS